MSLPENARSQGPPPPGPVSPELLSNVVAALLGARHADGHWQGELSSSALSTATAACALALHRRARPDDRRVARHLVADALDWIVRHQNDDGGWGDTVDSPSNVSTTVLCWVALGVEAAGERPRLEDVPGDEDRSRRQAVPRAEEWLTRHAGGLTPAHLTRCLMEVYGDDRTFSIPILTMCALGGRFGEGRAAWEPVQPLPFELGAVPQRWLHRLGLPIVSYALPALIAIGQVNAHCRPSRNPILRLLRRAARGRTLKVLQRIQPPGGGFLEAAPLTSFVAMSLIGCERADHPVVDRAVGFLVDTVRADGSWPIDTNLSLWLTTLSVNALARGGRLEERLGEDERAHLLRWLLAQQHRKKHPYTGAAPGGWAWTDLVGGVPDADDTAGALLAVHHLAGDGADALAERAWDGIRWLIDLQNRDGGIPTFCRGWGRLPFDRSSPDLTAHALRAWSLWRPHLPGERRQRVDGATTAAVRYLLDTRHEDGSWVPLWFGNQEHPALENPVYGTSRVLLAGDVVVRDETLQAEWAAAIRQAGEWLLAARNDDGGWGGAPGIPSSVEETALALDAMPPTGPADLSALPAAPAVRRAVRWLQRATAGGREYAAAPIGLYFARLWYSERLYPLIFTAGALERLKAAAAPEGLEAAAAPGPPGAVEASRPPAASDG